MRVVCSHVLFTVGLVLTILLYLGSRIDSREEMAVAWAWDIAVGLMFATAYLLSRRSSDSPAAKRRWPVALKATLIGVVMGGWLVLFQELVYRARMTIPPRVLAANQVQMVLSAMQEYRDDHGSYPATEQGLTALLEPAQQSSQPYVDAEMLIDPWGRPLRYRNEDNVITVWSLGPDGESGTDDDITVPRAEERQPVERGLRPRG